MKICWRDRDSFQFVGCGMAGCAMRDLNSKWPFKMLTKRDRDQDSGSGRMEGSSQK